MAFSISRSLRFNAVDTAYLSRSVTAGNRRLMTLSVWFKLGNNQGTHRFICSADRSGVEGFGLYVVNTDAIQCYQWNGATFDFNYVTNAVLRDPAAWYHLVLKVDTANATAGNRVQLFLNGVQLTSFGTAADPAQNLDLHLNNTTAHAIGRSNYSTTNYFDGYMAEINFVDGQALSPTSFGAFDVTTGSWTPQAYAGVHGTSGFHLDFADNSGTTSTTLGKDTGNSNNWTPNSFSVAAGTGNDSLIDTPTNNFATLSYVDRTTISLDNGGLEGFSGGAVSVYRHGMATFKIDQPGRYYFETSAFNDASVRLAAIGVVSGGVLPAETSTVTGSNTNFWAFSIENVNANASGKIYNNGSVTNSAAQFTYAGETIGVAIFADSLTNIKVGFNKNGTWLHSFDPSTGANAPITGLTAPLGIVASVYQSGIVASHRVFVNFGQRAFTTSLPSGYRRLCAVDTPFPSIRSAKQHFNGVLWTGDGNATKAVTGLGHQPDFAWAKARSSAFDHVLANSTVGAQNALISDTTSAEVTGPRFSSFDSDGFTVGNGGGSVLNNNATTYVAWSWKESATAGFDVATFTTIASASQTFNHSLGAAPHFLFMKRRDSTSDWFVYHRNMNASPQGGYLKLNTTAAFTSDTTLFNNTVPSSSVVTLGSAFNSAGTNWVAYLWTEIAGFSRIGSYTGNGSTDGPFVWCGFRPKFVMFKPASATGNWFVRDTARSPFNANTASLWPNLSDAESAGAAVDLLSNGFKVRSNAAGINTNGDVMAFVAFAEVPFKYATIAPSFVEFVGSGGITSSGSAAFSKAIALRAAGGIISSGAALFNKLLNLIGSGGIFSSGSAPMEKIPVDPRTLPRPLKRRKGPLLQSAADTRLAHLPFVNRTHRPR